MTIVTVAGLLVAFVARTRTHSSAAHARKGTKRERATTSTTGLRRLRRERRRRRRRRVVLAVLVCLTVFAAIATALQRGRGSHPQVVAATAAPPGPIETTSSTTTTTTVTTIVDNGDVTYIATPRAGFIVVYDAPNQEPATKLFPNPWYVNDDHNAAVPLVFHVEVRRSDGWLQVQLPIRPNGSLGWIRTDDVVLSPTHFRITVELAAHRLRVYQDSAVLFEDKVAVGAPGTPTPTGKYYIRALLKAPRPGTVYGPFAYGLSGYSEALQTFNGGDAELGIHGNDDASKLGTDASHGCIRMSNDGITLLTTVLPLGTPVEITE